MCKKQEERCSKSHYQNRLYAVLLEWQNINYRKVNIKHFAYLSVLETREWECISWSKCGLGKEVPVDRQDEMKKLALYALFVHYHGHILHMTVCMYIQDKNSTSRIKHVCDLHYSLKRTKALKEIQHVLYLHFWYSLAGTREVCITSED